LFFQSYFWFEKRRRAVILEPFYHTLFEIMPVPSVIVIAGHIVRANPAALIFLDAQDSSQIVGHALAEFVYPMDLTRSDHRLNRKGPRWENAPAQFRVRTVTGHLKMLLSSSMAVRFEEKDAILISGLDMTAEAEMEEQLRRSEQDFRAFFENMQDVYYRTDADGVITMAGPSVHEVLGFKPEEIVGRRAEEFYPLSTDRDAIKKAILEDGKVSDFPGQIVRKDGRLIDISISSRALYDASGGFLGVEGIYRDVTQRKMLERELQRLATTDPLTNIANRRSFLEQAEQIFKHSQRYFTSFTMLMLDLDFFKGINDQHGHLCGDTVLAKFSQIVGLELRDSDVFGRLGGEEFCILLQQADQEEAMNVAERIRRRIEDSSFESPDCAPVMLTVSIGASTNRRTDERLTKLFERADKALYQAKHTGRNRVLWLY
jgi:diguanylate cyclase (GGDEF)-like protein/PAS domain S-box-containing protein